MTIAAGRGLRVPDHRLEAAAVAGLARLVLGQERVELLRAPELARHHEAPAAPLEHAGRLELGDDDLRAVLLDGC